MKILYGTGNPGKLDSMRKRLEPLRLEILGLKDLDYPWPDIQESGNDPLENARIKALAYYEVCKIPVFSCDSGLYIDGLKKDRQPGVYIKRVNGKTLTDQEMIDHYSGIAAKLGGKCFARYRNAICFVKNENEIYEDMSEDIASEKFMIAAKPHRMREAGFPLDSLSIHIPTGKYYYDLEDTSISITRDGFLKFFENALYHR